MKISAQFMPGDLPVFVESVRRAEEVGYARAYPSRANYYGATCTST